MVPAFFFPDKLVAVNLVSIATMTFNVVILLVIIISSTDGELAASDLPFLLECRIPSDSVSLNQSVIDTESGLLSQKDMEQLELEGRCFLGCATEY